MSVYGQCWSKKGNNWSLLFNKYRVMPESPFCVLQILICLISRTPQWVTHYYHFYLPKKKLRYKAQIKLPQIPLLVSDKAGIWNQVLWVFPSILPGRWKKEKAEGLVEATTLQQNPLGPFQTSSQWRWAPHVLCYYRWEVRYWKGWSVVTSDRWQPEDQRAERLRSTIKGMSQTLKAQKTQSSFVWGQMAQFPLGGSDGVILMIPSSKSEILTWNHHEEFTRSIFSFLST